MSVAYFITHPEVVVDADRPVPRWHLSDKGIHRMRAFSSRADLGNLSAVWASTETKAIEAAGILAGHFGLPVSVHHGLHENERSATGFLPPPEFDRIADAFFARPEVRIPAQSGQVFRFEAGQHSGMKPDTVPINCRTLSPL